MFGPSVTYQVKLMQGTAMEQKRLDLRLLSPTLRNLWLLLVTSLWMTQLCTCILAYCSFDFLC